MSLLKVVPTRIDIGALSWRATSYSIENISTVGSKYRVESTLRDGSKHARTISKNYLLPGELVEHSLYPDSPWSVRHGKRIYETSHHIYCKDEVWAVTRVQKGLSSWSLNISCLKAGSLQQRGVKRKKEDIRGLSFILVGALGSAGPRVCCFAPMDGNESSTSGSAHKQVTQEFGYSEEDLVAAGAFDCDSGSIRWSSGYGNLGSRNKNDANAVLGNEAAKDLRNLDKVPGPWNTKEELNRSLLGKMVKHLIAGQQEGMFDIEGSKEIWQELDIKCNTLKENLLKEISATLKAK